MVLCILSRFGSHCLLRHFLCLRRSGKLSLKSLSIRANVSNLFDEKYYGSISSTNGAVALTGFTPSAPFYAIGSPRTVSATVQVQF
jgi:outer membrane receptor protein involved in Fe transport